jgi:hypothetical protein
MCALGDHINMRNKENWVECGLNGSDKKGISAGLLCIREGIFVEYTVLVT